MKKLNWATLLLLLILIASAIVQAKTETITTSINGTYDSTTDSTIIKTEGGYQSSVGCSNGSTTSFPITFTRTVDCTTTECDNSLNNLSKFFQIYVDNTTKIQSQYTECYASKERVIQAKDDYAMNLQKEINISSEYKTKYDSCTNQLTSCQATNSQLSTCQTQLKTAKDQQLLWGIIGVGAGAVAYYIIKKKPEAKTPMDQMLR